MKDKSQSGVTKDHKIPEKLIGALGALSNAAINVVFGSVEQPSLNGLDASKRPGFDKKTVGEIEKAVKEDRESIKKYFEGVRKGSTLDVESVEQVKHTSKLGKWEKGLLDSMKKKLKDGSEGQHKGR